MHTILLSLTISFKMGSPAAYESLGSVDPWQTTLFARLSDAIEMTAVRGVELWKPLQRV